MQFILIQPQAENELFWLIFWHEYVRNFRKYFVVVIVWTYQNRVYEYE